MSNRLQLSACVITRNEERVLARCLSSLKFADEIVVIDAESSDRTVEIAKQFSAKVLIKAWSGFAAQRNAGLKHCEGQWVFFLDADEEASSLLGERLSRISRDN